MTARDCSWKRWSWRCAAAVAPMAALALAPLWGDGSLAAQRADRTAVEAVIESIPPATEQLYVSPLLGQNTVRGNVLIKESDRERLKELYGAKLERPEALIECSEPTDPSTCRMPRQSVLYQFVMPERVSPGVLHIQLVRLVSDARGMITRELWEIALVETVEVGWHVGDKEKVFEGANPW